MPEDQQAKMMYLGQKAKNLLLRLNKDEKNLVIELDEAGMSTILEKMIELRGYETIVDWINQIHECTEVDQEDDDDLEIEGVEK